VATTMRVQLSGSEAGLAGYWPLDDGQGYLLRDRGANHLDAALVYPAPKSALNGTTTRAAQYQPQWLQRSVWESNPFDWTAQPQTTKQVTEVQRLIPIDFDSDGDMDLVSAGYYYPGRSEPSLKAYRNDGKGNFTESTADVFGSTPILVRTAARSIVTDLNHDGKPDLILGDYGSDYGGPDGGKGQNRIFIEAANGQLRDETVSRLPQTQQYVHDLDGADVNGDGQIDLVYPDTTALPFQLTLAMNDGSGKFARDNTRLPQSAAGRFPTVVRFLDANGDGKPDLFLGVGESAGDPTDILLLNNGSGTFLSMAAGALPKRKGGPACRTVNAGVADLNNDGLPDLLLTIFCDGYSEGGFQVLLNQGKGVYADATAQWLPDSLVRAGSLYATDFPWMRNVLFADFNGDGKIDVVIESLVSRPRMYMNNGRRLVETPEFLPNREMQQPGNGGVAVADFNGDGLPDIVIADQSQANTFDTLYVGLHRRPYTLPDSPVADPAAPLVVRLDVLNEASASADMPAPGTRLLINGTNVGPQSAVTFDGITARVSSNSSGDLVAIVPFALDGRWVTSMQVRNGDQVSDSVPVPLAPANPRIYTKQFADGSTVVDVWRIANGARTKITAAGQLHWGDRIAFRMTGAGQGSTAISDDSSAMEQTFVPATPFTLQIGSTTGTPYQVNPVSMRYAPDGLSGVVEVVIDLPASRPPGATNEFGLVNVRFRSLVGVNLPF
jgi:uncharacterized protein (TIGR03437 family)